MLPCRAGSPKKSFEGKGAALFTSPSPAAGGANGGDGRTPGGSGSKVPGASLLPSSVTDWLENNSAVGGGKPAAAASAKAPAGEKPTSFGAGRSGRSVEALGGQLFTWLVRLLVFNAAAWVAVGILEEFVEPISRRACNATYVLWVAALCTSMIGGCLMTEIMGTVLRGSSRGIPHLLLAVNRNMLLLFLIANLATGAVNMSINTLAVTDWPARAIVTVYITAVSALAVALDYAGLTVKFW